MGTESADCNGLWPKGRQPTAEPGLDTPEPQGSAEMTFKLALQKSDKHAQSKSSQKLNKNLLGIKTAPIDTVRTQASCPDPARALALIKN